ncbi:MFS general substrate transporter [Atractiella rhizophila]|nr:MFS general substrate transporter [Atractiella rhizophila]
MSEKLEEIKDFDDAKSDELSSPTSPRGHARHFHEEVGADVEIGYDLYKEAVEEKVEWTKAEERKIVRRIDWLVLPAFCLLQGLAYLDKTALNYGNLFGMKKDLHVNGDQFSWFASAFYLASRTTLLLNVADENQGYLVSAYPTTLLLQKYPSGRVMGAICTVWGVVVCTTASCRSFGGALANRIFLGALEAAVTPGLSLLTPMWWTLQEIPVRQLTWYAQNGVAGIIGGFLAYGLGHANNASVPSWALIFLTLGGFTVFVGLCILIFLPDSPASARWLSSHQKTIAIKRVAGNRTGTKNKQFKLYQVQQAFLDPKTYILFIASVAAQIPNGVVSNFSSIIIKGFGFNQFQTTLLDIPSSVLQIISLVGSGYLAGKFPNSRVILMAVGNITCIIAASVLTYGPQSEKWGRLVAFWFTSFQSVGFSLSLVIVGSNVGGFTKKQVTMVVTFIGYCVGNIAGPHVLIDSEAPKYPTATKAMLAGYVIKTGMHIILGVYMYLENRRRDRKAIEDGSVLEEVERAKRAEELGMMDTTEKDNPYFRYVL